MANRHTLQIDPEFQHLILPLSADEFALLERNLLQDGCREPLSLWGDILLDGHHRYEICIRHHLPFDTVQIEIADRKHATNWIINNQLGRRNATPEQASYLRGKQYIEARKPEGAPQGNNNASKQLDQNDLVVSTAQRLAQAYKVSEPTIKRDAKFTEAVDKLANQLGAKARDEILTRDTKLSKKDVQALAKETPKTQTRIFEMITQQQVKSVGEAKRRLRQEAALLTPPVPQNGHVLDHKYGVILADPPWPFRVWHKPTGSGRSAASHYPTMSLEDLYNLNVQRLAADQCALFLWAVWPSLPEALTLIEAWGFTYKTIAWVWVKQTQTGQGWHWGMGYYTRANSEPCLLAVKGEMPVAARDELSLIVSPVRGHSQKPDEQYPKINRLYPDLRRLELFARQAQPGWVSLGNMMDGRDVSAYLTA